VSYPEDGHATIDKLPNQPDPKTWSIHWTGIVGQDLKFRRDLNSSNLLVTRNFDDGICVQGIFFSFYFSFIFSFHIFFVRLLFYFLPFFSTFFLPSIH